MAEQRPTLGLRALPQYNQVLFDSLFCCVRCKKVPHPEQYYVCKDNGHFHCEVCTTKKNNSTTGETSVTQVSFPVGSCCTPDKLLKGATRFLQMLFRNSYWDCEYKNDGCEVIILGQEWARHVIQCDFQHKIACKYIKCPFKGRGVSELVDHMKVDHQATQFGGQVTKLDVEYTETAPRLIALLTYQEKHYLFAAEVQDSIVYMWTWDLAGWGREKKETQKYELLLNLAQTGTGKRSSQEGMRFIGSCLPYELTSSEIMEDARCFVVPLAILAKNYVQMDKPKKMWTISIKLLKGNANPVE